MYSHIYLGLGSGLSPLLLACLLFILLLLLLLIVLPVLSLLSLFLLLCDISPASRRGQDKHYFYRSAINSHYNAIIMP